MKQSLRRPCSSFTPPNPMAFGLVVADSCEGEVRPGTGSCASEGTAGPHPCNA